MLSNKIVDFFLNDGPIISDLTRITIYGYLFFDCYIAKFLVSPGDSPFYAHLLFQKIHPLFWCVQNKFSSYFIIFHNYSCLKILAWICKISWICCIFGFGGIFARLITGLSAFILSTTYIGIGKIGVSHRWYVPTWTLLALIFAKFGKFSIDFLINYYINDYYNFEPNSILFNSGFASKFIQIICIYSLFGGAVTKLRLTGIRWVLPGTLSFYLAGPAIESYFVLRNFRHSLRIFIINTPLLVAVLSILTLFMEIISITALFLQSVRFYLSIVACLFHFGVLIIQTPNFISQCVCYGAMIGAPLPSMIIQQINFVDWLIIGGLIIIIVAHILTLIFKYEGWPFSWIPMFALDRCQFTHDYIIDENQLTSLAREFPLLNGISGGGEDHFSEGPSWIRITKNFENKDIIVDICKHVCPIEHAFRHSLSSALMRSLLVSKVEMNLFLNDLFNLLLTEQVQFINKTDIINVQIDFKQQGWTTYATSNLKQH